MRTGITQKSARTNPAPNKGAERLEPMPDKGQKFEPFYIPAIGSGRSSVAWASRLDQKR